MNISPKNILAWITQFFRCLNNYSLMEKSNLPQAILIFSTLFHPELWRTVMTENKRSTREPFSALGSYLLSADTMLSACPVACPSPARTGFSLHWPPTSSLQCDTPHHSPKKKQALWGTGWLAQMRHGCWFQTRHYASLFPKGRCCQNQSISTKDISLDAAPISNGKKQISRTALPGVYILHYAPTG